MNLITTLGDKASRNLDLIRGLAAVLVMSGHLRGLFFVEYGQVNHPNIFVKAFYFLTSLGHQSVMVFFVLSGYFISASVLKTMSMNKWSWPWYLNQRLTRLWIVLLPALLLTALWDQTGMHLFGREGVYGGLPSDQYILHSVSKTSSFSIFLSNFFFLQSKTITFGSNGALWSLSHEFWYYLLFPLGVLLIAGQTPISRLSSFISLFLISLFIGRDMMLYFLTWLMGTAVLILQSRVASTPKSLYMCWFGGILFFCSLLAFQLHPLPANDFFIAASFGILLLGLVLRPHSTQNNTSKSQQPRNFAQSLADFSFTLYVAHLPPLVFLHAWIYARGSGKWQPDIKHVLLAALLFGVVLTYAYLLSLLTEVKTDRVRRFIAQKFLTPRLVPVEAKS